METLYFILVGLSGLVGFSELAFFANTSPALFGNLPFKHRQEIPLPDADEGVLRKEATGDTQPGTWRYIPGLRMLVFRRRFSAGRKPYAAGCFRFDSEGRASLTWSPFPLVTLPLLTLLGPALGWVVYTNTGLFPALFAPTLMFGLAWAANWMLSRNHFHEQLLPEIEMAWAEHTNR